MRLLDSHHQEHLAFRRARELQSDASMSTLICVEYDSWKEPQPYRVLGFDLNDRRDRACIVPIGVERVNGVYPIMFARRLALMLPLRVVHSEQPPVIEHEEIAA